jgi:FkbM family methyltransferase
MADLAFLRSFSGGGAKVHPVFEFFPPQASGESAEFIFNFLAVRTRKTFCRPIVTNPERNPPRDRWPPVNEDYFEWIDLLEAVHGAGERFTMIELGAGYGRWLANAAGAVARLGRSCHLVGVEAEPAHFDYLAQNLRDNGVAGSSCTLVRAAAGASPGSVWFHVGRPDEWYGQAIDANSTPVSWWKRWFRRGPLREVQADGKARELVRVVSLDQLLAPLPLVDLIDLDVQGAELDVLASSSLLDRRVGRVHIGTHNSGVEAGLRLLFQRLGWVNRGDYPCLTADVSTPFGPVSFQDGVQSWLNPRLANIPEYAGPSRSAA